MKSKIATLLFFISFSLFAAHKGHFEAYDLAGEELKGKSKLLSLKSQDGLGVEVITRNFNKSDKIKLYKAIEILKVVINSEEFKKKVLTYNFKGTGGFHRNNGMTNLQIYNHLMTGAENLRPKKDKKMNFDLTLYRSLNPFSKVKGYTKPDTMRIWIHKKFYRKRSWTAIDTASNLVHEWVHKMGFGHDYYYNEDRPHSVPYAIGSIVGKLAKSMGY